MMDTTKVLPARKRSLINIVEEEEDDSVSDRELLGFTQVIRIKRRGKSFLLRLHPCQANIISERKRTGPSIQMVFRLGKDL